MANNFTVVYELTCAAKKKTLANLPRLVGRSIQGIGGGGILTLGEIIVTDLVPLAVRGGMVISALSLGTMC